MKIRGKRTPKINAAQASHLGRIARECRARSFIALGDELCAHETAFSKERTFPHTLHAIHLQILDLQILTRSD